MKGEKHHAAVSRLFDNSIDLIDGGGAMWYYAGSHFSLPPQWSQCVNVNFWGTKYSCHSSAYFLELLEILKCSLHFIKHWKALMNYYSPVLPLNAFLNSDPKKYAHVNKWIKKILIQKLWRNFVNE
jgi:hypothetical protein